MLLANIILFTIDIKILRPCTSQKLTQFRKLCGRPQSIHRLHLTQVAGSEEIFLIIPGAVVLQSIMKNDAAKQIDINPG